MYCTPPPPTAAEWDACLPSALLWPHRPHSSALLCVSNSRPVAAAEGPGGFITETISTGSQGSAPSRFLEGFSAQGQRMSLKRPVAQRGSIVPGLPLHPATNSRCPEGGAAVRLFSEDTLSPGTVATAALVPVQAGLRAGQPQSEAAGPRRNTALTRQAVSTPTHTRTRASETGAGPFCSPPPPPPGAPPSGGDAAAAAREGATSRK